MVRFYSFLDGATLATLVCEDLARIDPVQPVLRAVGPNLVIALLMDGPQVEQRWPGRYATVLADDPGSSVLTLTSAGFLDRYIAHYPGCEEHKTRAIALWKDPSRRAEPIELPRGAHAVVLKLSVKTVEERTMDRRSDDGATREIRWGSATPVSHPHPPAWLIPGTRAATLPEEAERGEG